ncbi:hypothetical protein B566_EDAN008948 [Ephemera danica]|nr:hypothetical protein B566_EDAN008948 [Ephemera danica]
MFPHASADTSHRPRHPTAEEAEPDFTEDDEYEDPESELQGSSFQKSRVPPHANWSPNRPRRPTTSYQPPSPPTQIYQPNVVKQRQPIEITTFPPIFNKDLRKRNRYRNKNRQDSIDDLEDSESIAAPQVPPERNMPHQSSTEPPHFLPTTLRPIISRPPAPVVTNAPIIRPPPPPTRPPAPAIKQPAPIRRPSRPRPSQMETVEDGSRINYSYHPIIDFFREDQQLKQQQIQINRRADKLVSAGNDEWRPIVPSNRPSLRGA